MKATCLVLILLIAAPVYAQQYTVTVSVVTDWETVQSYGGPAAAQAALQAIVDDASAIYENQMGLKLIVTMWTIPTSAAQDFPSEDTNASALLNALVLYREASSQQCQQGMTLLMTTRVFTDGIIGLSNTGSACYAQAAGIVEVNYGDGNAIIAAHEIGHILGADHDGDAAGSCPAVAQGEYIMSPYAYPNATNTFSPCTVAVITKAFALHSCIVPVQVDVAPQAAAPAPAKGGGGKVDVVVLAFLGWMLLITTRTRYAR